MHYTFYHFSPNICTGIKVAPAPLIWGETISRDLGNEDNAYLEAWKLNVENQNQIVINNNTLATLLIGYAFNDRPEIDFEIEPQDLLKDLRIYAMNNVFILFSKGKNRERTQNIQRSKNNKKMLSLASLPSSECYKEEIGTRNAGCWKEWRIVEIIKDC
ncbi:MAG: hypothetical protein DLM72_17210 [Candidatus Nitrosopolaris wilkensis]|nr:MAG: hypothetical protein DLM72_17210 [Candidatus Nitrosopolaris wilkensis]